MNTPSEPKILTIGILTFNRSTYLSELLKSITKQKISTLNKIEILILNNGSTDDTNKILKEYENLINLRLIYQSKNVRGSKSYKKLIEQANGEFILFPGDDDVFPESALDNIVIQLNLQSKNVTMIAANAKVIDESNNLLKIYYNPPVSTDKTELLALLFERSAYWMPSTFIRTSIIKNLQTPESLTSFDWYLWILASTKGEVKNLQDIVILYRKHEEREQNSFLEESWDLDSAIMFAYAINQGAIHEWLSVVTNSVLVKFLSKLSSYHESLSTSFATKLKYFYLIQEISKNRDITGILAGLQLNPINSVDPRFVEAILGIDMEISDFRQRFEDMNIVFSIDSIDKGPRNGIHVVSRNNDYEVQVRDNGNLTINDSLSKSEVVDILFSLLNEHNRGLREIELTKSLTRFERRILSVIRSAKRIKHGRKFTFSIWN